VQSKRTRSGKGPWEKGKDEEQEENLKTHMEKKKLLPTVKTMRGGGEGIRKGPLQGKGKKPKATRKGVRPVLKGWPDGGEIFWKRKTN